MAGPSDAEYFARLVEALDPWLDQVVIIGGWAHRLYRLHPLAQPLDYEPLGTFDTDIAVPLDLPTTGEQIRARLLERDFREELMGDMQPPAAHYRVESEDNSFYAEFLAPLEGSAVKRGGRRDVTARVSGVSVQKLRHLELLLRNPWDVMIAPASGYPTPGVRRILVPNAAAFLVQKILIHEKRDRDRRAKDILYIVCSAACRGSKRPRRISELRFASCAGRQASQSRQFSHWPSASVPPPPSSPLSMVCFCARCLLPTPAAW
jgi:hypothetical protein